jgi:hypothetical protein
VALALVAKNFPEEEELITVDDEYEDLHPHVVFYQ